MQTPNNPGKQPRRKMTKTQCVGWLILLTLAIAAIICVYEIKAKDRIETDIQEKLNYISKGNLSWIAYSTVEISPVIQNSLWEEPDEEMDVISYLISQDEFEYKIGLVGIKNCRVKFKCTGYDYSEFINYCEALDVQSYDEMRDCLEEYSQNSIKTMVSEFELVYGRKDGRWVCDYDTPEFMENVTCGVINAYSDYYEESMTALQKFIESMDEGDKTNEEKQ